MIHHRSDQDHRVRTTKTPIATNHHGMSFRTDLRTSFWAEVRHQATHPAAVTKPGAPFEEAVGICRVLVKANLPARPGDLARAASQVPIGSSRGQGAQRRGGPRPAHT